MTAIEFLTWLESLSGDQRYELVSGEAIAIAPERNRHNLVKTACHRALGEFVQCGAPIDLDATTVPTPIILVEVLSPSTSGVDAGGKLFGYFQLPSVEHYLSVASCFASLGEERC